LPFSPAMTSLMLSYIHIPQDLDESRRSRITLGEIPFPMLPTAASIKARSNIGDCTLLPPKEHMVLVPDDENPCLMPAENIVIASIPTSIDLLDMTPLVEEARRIFGPQQIYV